MHLIGPHHYVVTIGSSGHYAVASRNGESGFRPPLTGHCPKLYAFTSDGTPVYVGQTVQAMATRLGIGFRASGATGYYGYRFRHDLPMVDLLVWCLHGAISENPAAALESIEAEVVFAYRAMSGQWPRYQTEIHFHQTTVEHRLLAAQVLGSLAASQGDQ